MFRKHQNGEKTKIVFDVPFKVLWPSAVSCGVFHFDSMSKREKENASLEIPQAKKHCAGANKGVYVIEYGRRWVPPYFFTFSTFAKKRWWGEPLLATYAKEFSAHTKDYYVTTLIRTIDVHLLYHRNKQSSKEELQWTNIRFLPNTRSLMVIKYRTGHTYMNLASLIALLKWVQC